MRLTPEQLIAEGEDGGLIHFIDTAFMASSPPKRIGIAVSGGGDSMALLHLAWRWSVLAGAEIEAVTVNHGLRPEAQDEAEMVAGLCARLDVPHTTVQWDGTAAHGNLAAAGRDARYRLIAQWAKAHKINGVLLGHTVDDIAETFLMRLARKSGVDGLSMMDVNFEREGMKWARPFWQQKRADLRDYLQRQEITWADDPTNEDENYDRPKARKALAALEPLGITREVLKTVALNMGVARGALETYAVSEAERVLREESGDIVVSQRAIPLVSQEIERRLMVAALRYVGGRAYAPRADAVLDLEIGLMSVGKHTLSGCIVTSDGKTLRITREYDAVKNLEVPLGQIWDRRWQVVGPFAADLTVRALGDDLKEVPNWRDTGLPRDSLRASPAVFKGGWLISAPLAGLQNGFDARIVADFTSFLLSR